MSVQAFIESVEKDAEIVVTDVLKVFTKVKAAEPGALAALGAVMASVTNALADVTGIASNPTQISVQLPQDIADFKAIWPTVIALLKTFGITVK
jgi:hypothetical protein